jgi:putative solute:sodium symporter small subunit
MAEPSDSRNDSPIVALLIVAATIVLLAAVATRTIDLHFEVRGWNLHHWMTWAGALFVAFFTPFFYVLKRRGGNTRATLIGIHMYGGLLAAALVSTHFMQHVTRPPEFYPDLGTGVVLWVAFVLSVLTGFLIRYQWLKGGMREWRAIHVGTAVTFYLAIGMHIATGLGWA